MEKRASEKKERWINKILSFLISPSALIIKFCASRTRAMFIYRVNVSLFGFLTLFLRRYACCRIPKNFSPPFEELSDERRNADRIPFAARLSFTRHLKGDPAAIFGDIASQSRAVAFYRHLAFFHIQNRSKSFPTTAAVHAKTSQSELAPTLFTHKLRSMKWMPAKLHRC